MTFIKCQGGGLAEGTFLLIEIVVEVLLALNSWRVPVKRQPLAFPVFMIVEERSGEFGGKERNKKRGRVK